MAQKVCRIIKPEAVEPGSLKLRMTPRGDGLLTGKVLGTDAESTVAIKFSAETADASAQSICHAFSGELFDAAAAAFGFSADTPTEEITDAEFARIVGTRDMAVGAFGALALEPKGLKYEITIARAGETLFFADGKPVVFSAKTLRDAVPLFDGVKLRVYRNSARFDHLINLNPALAAQFPEGIDEAVVGSVSEVAFSESDSTLRAAAVLDATPQAGALDKMLRRAAEVLGGLSTFMGLSMIVDMWRDGEGNALAIEACHGVDVVSVPAAGGHFERLAASFAADNETREGFGMKKTLIQKILAFSAGHKEADLEAQDENALLAVWMGLVEEKKVADEKKVTDLTAQIATLSAQAKAPDTTGLKGLEDKLLALANQIAAADTEAKLNVLRMSAVSRVEKSTLPDLSKKRLTAVVMGLSAVTEDAVTALIKDETDFITELTKDQHGFSGLGQIEEGLNSKEKLSAAFAAELGVPGADGKIDKQWGMLGIKKFYQQTTGDYDMRQKPNFKRASFAAAQSSDFADMLAPVLYKKLLAEYQEAPYPDGFLVDDVRTATDFKNMRSGTVGGFGVMDVVDEGGTYQPVAIPTDYYSEYAVEKRGALLPITWETIVNDDIGLIRRLVMLFGRAARRTHSQYVFSLMTDNPNTYDIHPLFSAAYHSNYGTGALATGELETIKLAMFKQTEPGSGARLGLVMEHLFIPIDLQVTANNINQREYLDSARVTPNPFWHQFGANNENIHVVPHWTNAKDWYIKGRGKDAPFIEMAYLNGMKEPELLLQDNPIVGSVFTADTFTYKVRHIYNGKCLDWRNVYFEDVT